jgi:hypothetical protein
VAFTKLDDYLVHQTPETVDRVYTSDRNFYDRYFYGSYSLDGAAYLLLAFGLYPNIGVMDAFATAVIDGKTQYIVRASRAYGHDRMDTRVGPIAVEVVEPLRTSRISCDANDVGLTFDMRFDAVIPPFEEPHFLRMANNRRIMDYTRMTQQGRMSGTFTAAGRTWGVDPSAWWGIRDHSWGIRPIGGGEPPSAPAIDGGLPAFYWQWSPMQFDSACLMYTRSEDADGRPWHEAAELLPAQASSGQAERLSIVSHDLKIKPGTRLFERGALALRTASGNDVRITMEPKSTLYMAGGGYAYMGGWRHGQYHAPLAVETETWDLTDAATVAKAGVHTQTLCDYHVDGLGDLGIGHGIFEFLSLGAYLPYGWKSFGDVAGA